MHSQSWYPVWTFIAVNIYSNEKSDFKKQDSDEHTNHQISAEVQESMGGPDAPEVCAPMRASLSQTKLLPNPISLLSSSSPQCEAPNV